MWQKGPRDHWVWASSDRCEASRLFSLERGRHADEAQAASWKGRRGCGLRLPADSPTWGSASAHCPPRGHVISVPQPAPGEAGELQWVNGLMRNH